MDRELQATEQLPDHAATQQLGDKLRDRILFKERSYFVAENDGAASIDVIRLGDCKHKVDVLYTAARASGSGDLIAEESEDFVGTTGVLTFEAGEFLASFKVPIVDNKYWGECRRIPIRALRPRRNQGLRL